MGSEQGQDQKGPGSEPVMPSRERESRSDDPSESGEQMGEGALAFLYRSCQVSHGLESELYLPRTQQGQSHWSGRLGPWQ